MGGYSPDEDIRSRDYYMYQNICHITVIVPVPNVPAADVFGTDIFP